MTVGELKEALSKYPDNMEVVAESQNKPGWYKSVIGPYPFSVVKECQMFDPARFRRIDSKRRSNAIEILS